MSGVTSTARLLYCRSQLEPKGVSVNLGKKGAHLNAGLPGTGISSRTKIFGGAGSSSEKGQVSPLFVYAVLGLLVLGLMIWIL